MDAGAHPEVSGAWRILCGGGLRPCSERALLRRQGRGDFSEGDRATANRRYYGTGMNHLVAPCYRGMVGVLIICAAVVAYAALPTDDLRILNRLQGPLAVERIIDGDTFVLEGGERVRLIGVDAPEVGYPDAYRSSALLALLIRGRDVFLEFDLAERDRFGRLLAYVYLDDEEGHWVSDDGMRLRQVNHELALAGLAAIMTVPPNVAYVEVYLDATREARAAKRGFWREWDCVDVNSAPLARLREIIHVDEARATHLVEGRPYDTIGDLVRVKGLGPQRLDDIIRQGLACVMD
jgi:micrococcal nuclease